MRVQLLLAVTAAVSAAGKSFKEPLSRNKLLLISFDGFRWDYDQDVDTPNLDRLAKDGVKAKYITPPMLTMTSPSHFTTITGLLQVPLLPDYCQYINTTKYNYLDL